MHRCIIYTKYTFKNHTLMIYIYTKYEFPQNIHLYKCTFIIFMKYRFIECIDKISFNPLKAVGLHIVILSVIQYKNNYVNFLFSLIMCRLYS